MLKSSFVAVVLCILLATTYAADRIVVSETEAAPAETGHVVFVEIDTEAPIYAFSFAASFPSQLTLVPSSVELGSDVGGIVEWSELIEENDYFGAAVIFDWPENGYLDRTLPAGTGKEVLTAEFNVAPGLTCDDTLAITLRTDLGDPPIQPTFTVADPVTITSSVTPASVSGSVRIEVEPTVSSLSLTIGDTEGGDPITITGTGFTSDTLVLFGLVELLNMTCVDSTTITGTTPGHTAGTVNLFVSTPCGDITLPDAFTYVEGPPPQISNVSPAWVKPNQETPVTITGANFSAETEITFGFQSLQDKKFENSNTITGNAPAAGPGLVNVMASEGNDSHTWAEQFGYAGVPSLLIVTPNKGPGGLEITVFGENFTDERDGDLSVSYDVFTEITDFQVVSDTEMKVTIPACDGDEGWKSLTLTTIGGSAFLVQAYQCDSGIPPITFRRGDSNCDSNGDIGDAVYVLSYLFGAEPKPVIHCFDAADINDDGSVDISDPIYLLQHLFVQGPEPPPPSFDTPGTDPTSDSLDCAEQCGSP